MSDDPPPPLPQIAWHAELRLAPSSTVLSRDLPGDKILLPQSALEQLLSANPIDYNPTVRPSVAPTWPAPPPSYAESIPQRQLPSPLMFRLSTDSGNVVYCGIQEFSADDGEIVLSSHLVEALGVTLPADLEDATPLRPTSDSDGDGDGEVKGSAAPATPIIRVQARQLPKATYLRFRPLEAGYDPDDWRPLLERQLKSHTTLTKDGILSVRGVKGETFRLLADKFAPEGHGICVVDTDAEVDIEPLNEEQARETWRQLQERRAGKMDENSAGGTIDIFNPLDGQVVRGGYINYELESWDKSQPLSIVLECEGDGHDVDLFASPFSTRQRSLPIAETHIWSDMSSAQTKSVIIHPTNVELEGAEGIRISIHGYAAETKYDKSEAVRRYTLRAKNSVVPTLSTNGAYDPHTEDHALDDELCSNCKRWIPKGAATMHSIFCARNNELCPKCGKVFKRGDPERENHWHCDISSNCDSGDTPESFEKHMLIYHTASRDCWEPTCTAKGLTLPQLAEHRTTTCPGKLILCQFCHLEVPQEGDDPLNPTAETLLTGLTPHELAEGNRTTDCDLCGRIVRLRELAAHVKNHDIERENRLKPEICRNGLCGRTLHGVGRFGVVGAGTAMGQGPGNDIGLCSLCFGPLYSPAHDSEHKGLKRRIERRYLSQMMTGCGKGWCGNRWCKSGRKNLGVDEKGGAGGTAGALKEVKPLVLGALDMGERMWFCTDEGNQRGRSVAEGLAAEGGWDLEWAVAGCEAEKGNVDKAREWLGKCAPGRKKWS